MPWRPGRSFHALQMPGRGQHVADMDDVGDGGYPDADMVQARAAPIGEGDVVYAALSVHPHGPQLASAFGGRVFGRAEAQLVVEVVAGLHVGREAVDMVDALDFGAAIGAVFLQHRGQLIHREVEFERHAQGIGRGQAATLKGLLDEAVRQLPFS